MPMYSIDAEPPRVDPRARPLPGHRTRAARRPHRRDVQPRHGCRTQHRADRRCDPRGSRQAGIAQERSSRTVRVTTAATSSTGRRSTTSSVGSRRSTSTKVCATPSSGTPTNRDWWEPLRERAPVVERGVGSLGRVVVTGAGGLLGRRGCAGVRAAKASDVRRAARMSTSTLPIADHVRETFRVERPKLVVHCAAMTNVDACESNANARPCGERRRMPARRRGGGRRRRDRYRDLNRLRLRRRRIAPYAETDPTAPIQVYGASKLAGEERDRRDQSESLHRPVGWIYGPWRQELPVASSLSSRGRRSRSRRSSTSGARRRTRPIWRRRSTPSHPGTSTGPTTW